jgi:hypothetical protein
MSVDITGNGWVYKFAMPVREFLTFYHKKQLPDRNNLPVFVGLKAVPSRAGNPLHD